MIPFKHRLLAFALLLAFSQTTFAQVKKQYKDEIFAQTTVVIKDNASSATDEEILNDQFDIDDFGMDQVIRITTAPDKVKIEPQPAAPAEALVEKTGLMKDQPAATSTVTTTVAPKKPKQRTIVKATAVPAQATTTLAATEMTSKGEVAADQGVETITAVETTSKGETAVDREARTVASAERTSNKKAASAQEVKTTASVKTGSNTKTAAPRQVQNRSTTTRSSRSNRTSVRSTSSSRAYKSGKRSYKSKRVKKKRFKKKKRKAFKKNKKYRCYKF